MNINEIENILQSLIIRHPGIDDKLLSTLLKSSGWEDKFIKEAILLFHSKNNFPKMREGESFLPIEEKNVLPTLIKDDHLLENKEVLILEDKEPQSLIPPKPEILKKESELPNDLLLKPFESTNHVWSFSKYKDTFHGETMSEVMPKEVVPKIEPKIEIREKIVKEIVKEKVMVYVPEKVRFKKVPLTYKDEKLVVLASTMLLLIILLLVYMYSNGRL